METKKSNCASSCWHDCTEKKIISSDFGTQNFDYIVLLEIWYKDEKLKKPLNAIRNLTVSNNIGIMKFYAV